MYAQNNQKGVEMSKYTKGKWEVDKQSGGVSYIRCNKDYLATINTAYDGKNNTQKEIESKANANLIASAPEMLEALKTIAEYCDRSIYSPKIELYVKALIAKVEGGAK